ncbi:inositol monophosphatase 1 [Coccinella septempunctata]|uniref:inositol monophosphatase 1 n=1 Tax=Coccinella septempunctata TaxID=41139 RepID=UPI001D065BF0|nr:inositol monophosphatase 1 [Coccinella septempunctata]
MSLNTDKFLESALSVAKQAGELIRSQFNNRNKTITTKECDIDLVTETDKAVEELIINSLSKEFPDHRFIGEETTADGKKVELTEVPTWIIDPIDGTLNFVHSFPHSCISLALFINKEPSIAIVYNPMLEQLFTAQKGVGAFYNNKEMKVSGKQNLSEALIMYEVGTFRNAERKKVTLKNIDTLVDIAHGLRSTGSAALNMAMVALGAADAYFEFGIHVWDIAAGELLVTEAGGVIMDPSGGPIDRLSRRVLVASSKELGQQLSAKLSQFYPTPVD